MGKTPDCLAEVNKIWKSKTKKHQNQILLHRI